PPNNIGVQIQLITVSAKGIPQLGKLGISFIIFPMTYNPHIASIISVESDSIRLHLLSEHKKEAQNYFRTSFSISVTLSSIRFTSERINSNPLFNSFNVAKKSRRSCFEFSLSSCSSFR